MAVLPDWQPNLVPEGHYMFEIIEEPEVRITNKNKWLIVRTRIIFPDGKTRKYSDLFFPSDEKYRALLLVAGATPDNKGVPHLKEMDTSELVGVKFEADIVHIPDPKDEDKIRDTIKDIIVSDEVPSPQKEEEEDIPF